MWDGAVEQGHESRDETDDQRVPPEGFGFGFCGKAFGRFLHEARRFRFGRTVDSRLRAAVVGTSCSAPDGGHAWRCRPAPNWPVWLLSALAGSACVGD
jgi:hypothetical protein